MLYGIMLMLRYCYANAIANVMSGYANVSIMLCWFFSNALQWYAKAMLYHAIVELY